MGKCSWVIAVAVALVVALILIWAARQGLLWPQVSTDPEFEFGHSEMLPIRPEKEFLDYARELLDDDVFLTELEDEAVAEGDLSRADLTRLDVTILGVKSNTTKSWVDIKFGIRGVAKRMSGLTVDVSGYDEDVQTGLLYISRLNARLTSALEKRFGKACLQKSK